MQFVEALAFFLPQSFYPMYRSIHAEELMEKGTQALIMIVERLANEKVVG